LKLGASPTLAINAGNFLHPANPPITVLFDDCRKMTIHISKANLPPEQCLKTRTKSMRKQERRETPLTLKRVAQCLKMGAAGSLANKSQTIETHEG
jgi:hypothetical protein